MYGVEIARRVLVVEKPPVARVSLVSTGTFLNYYVHKHHSHIDHDVSLADPPRLPQRGDVEVV